MNEWILSSIEYFITAKSMYFVFIPISDVFEINKILTNYSIYRFINVNVDTYLSIESVYF